MLSQANIDSRVTVYYQPDLPPSEARVVRTHIVVSILHEKGYPLAANRIGGDMLHLAVKLDLGVLDILQ